MQFSTVLQTYQIQHTACHEKLVHEWIGKKKKQYRLHHNFSTDQVQMPFTIEGKNTKHLTHVRQYVFRLTFPTMLGQPTLITQTEQVEILRSHLLGA